MVILKTNLKYELQLLAANIPYDIFLFHGSFDRYK